MIFILVSTVKYKYRLLPRILYGCYIIIRIYNTLIKTSTVVSLLGWVC